MGGQKKQQQHTSFDPRPQSLLFFKEMKHTNPKPKQTVTLYDQVAWLIQTVQINSDWCSKKIIQSEGLRAKKEKRGEMSLGEGSQN